MKSTINLVSQSLGKTDWSSLQPRSRILSSRWAEEQPTFERTLITSESWRRARDPLSRDQVSSQYNPDRAHSARRSFKSNNARPMLFGQSAGKRLSPPRNANGKDWRADNRSVVRKVEKEKNLLEGVKFGRTIYDQPEDHTVRLYLAHELKKKCGTKLGHQNVEDIVVHAGGHDGGFDEDAPFHVTFSVNMTDGSKAQTMHPKTLGNTERWHLNIARNEKELRKNANTWYSRWGTDWKSRRLEGVMPTAEQALSMRKLTTSRGDKESSTHLSFQPKYFSRALPGFEGEQLPEVVEVRI